MARDELSKIALVIEKTVEVSIIDSRLGAYSGLLCIAPIKTIGWVCWLVQNKRVTVFG